MTRDSGSSSARPAIAMELTLPRIESSVQVQLQRAARPCGGLASRPPRQSRVRELPPSSNTVEL